MLPDTELFVGSVSISDTGVIFTVSWTCPVNSAGTRNGIVIGRLLPGASDTWRVTVATGVDPTDTISVISPL